MIIHKYIRHEKEDTEARLNDLFHWKQQVHW